MDCLFTKLISCLKSAWILVLFFKQRALGQFRIHHHPLHSNSFPAFLLDTSHEQQRVKLHMKTFVPDRTLGLQFKLIFAQLLEHSRGVARIFPWGTWPKYRFHNFFKCNLGQYPLLRGCVIPGESEYFPNYLNG